ncbi:hypothetical protein ACLOAU_18435 [Niabella sp. CJ426]|uniref:hypothetical protein n=1 Tax=Niabella sp. CJ426 TaxID=3393740 RepID=UPI003CFC5A79
MKLIDKYLFAAIVLLGGLSACTKTEYEQLKRPYAEIERFTIGGYGDLDSIPGVIHGDSILIYWNAKNTPPATVKPSIILSGGATIAPASGAEVPFGEATTYTVTAEDGSVRKFILKPVFNGAVPTVITMTSVRTWSATTPIAITGEYFLTTGNAKDIKLYAQRVRDGFEFDIPFDTAAVTATRINAYLPQFTSELDTGAHRIYVKVGDFSSNVAPIWLSQPILSEIIKTVDISNRGSISLGDEVEFTFTPKPEWKLAFERYYRKENFGSLNIGLIKIVPGQVINGQNYAMPAGLVTQQEPGVIKAKIDPVFFDTHRNSILFGGVIRYNNVSSINGTGGFTNYQFTISEYTALYQPVIEEVKYANVSLQQEGQSITRGQLLSLNYAFTQSEYTAQNTTLVAVRLKFKNKTTDTYTDITVPATSVTDNGAQLQFAIPTTANVVGQSLVAIGMYLRSNVNLRINIEPRKIITAETIVTQ